MDAPGGEAGSHASLINWHSYIGIPINFHEESGTPLDVSKGGEALCPEEVENYGFLYSLNRGFGHPFIL